MCFPKKKRKGVISDVGLVGLFAACFVVFFFVGF